MLSSLFDAPQAAPDTTADAQATADPAAITRLIEAIDRLAPQLAARHETDPPLDETALDSLFKAGLFMLTVPADAGGPAASQRDYTRVMERLGRLGPAYPITAVPHLCISVKSVAELAPRALRAAAFDDLKTRRKLIAFAITEACGSDVAAMQCKLTRTDDGGLRLNGNKEWITNLQRAGRVVVAARCPDHHPAPGAAVLVLVPLDAPGVSASPPRGKIIANGSDTASLYLDNVAVQEDWLLGEPGRGMHHFMDMVHPGRLGAAAALTGTARQALDESRERLGRTAAAALDSRLDVLSAATRTAAALGDARHPDYAHATAFAKAFVGVQAQCIIDRIGRAWAGTATGMPAGVRRAQRASGLFRLLKGPGEIISYQAISALTARWRHDLPEYAGPPASWPRETGELVSAFARILDRLYRADADGRHQLVLTALADLGAAVFVHLSALPDCDKAGRAWSRQGAEAALRHLETILDNQLHHRVDEWFERLGQAGGGTKGETA